MRLVFVFAGILLNFETKLELVLNFMISRALNEENVVPRIKRKYLRYTILFEFIGRTPFGKMQQENGFLVPK